MKKKKGIIQKETEEKIRRGIFRDRKLHSEYYTLYESLRESYRETHYRYLRMSKERFDHLLGLIHEEITKKGMYMREAVTAEEVW